MFDNAILKSVMEVAAQFAALAGVAGLVVILINVLKQMGVVKDGQAPVWSFVLNAVAFGLIVSIRVFKPDVDLVWLDANAAKIAQLLLYIAGLFFQVAIAKNEHDAIAGVPLIGKSFSRGPK